MTLLYLLFCLLAGKQRTHSVESAIEMSICNLVKMSLFGKVSSLSSKINGFSMILSALRSFPGTNN